MPTTVAKRSKDTYVANTVREFHQQLRTSLLLKDDMPNLVSAAPLALNLMGQLRLLAFSNAAKTVAFSHGIQKSDLLEHNNLPSCLVQLVSQGNEAFKNAHKNMKTLHMLAPQLFSPTGTMFDIVGLLEHPKDAKRHLPRQIELLRSGLDKCVNAVKDIETEFDIWSKMARELVDKATLEDHNVAVRRESADLGMRQTMLRQDITQQKKKDLVKQLAKLSDEAEIATSQFNSALNATSPWKDLGLVAVAESLNTTFGIINGAVDIAKAAPEMTIETVRAVGSLRPFAFDGSNTAFQQNDSPAARRTPFPQSEAPSARAYSAPQSVDYGIERAPEVQACVSELRKCIRSMSFEDLMSTADDEQGVLKDALKSIQKFKEELVAAGSPNCSEACRVLDQCLKIGTEISEKSQKTKVSELKKRQGNDILAEVDAQTWNKRLETLEDRALQLKAAAAARPGHALGADVPILNDIKKSFRSDRNRPIDTAALIAHKQEKMMILKATMEVTRAKHDEKTERLAEQQEEAMELSAKLENLKTSKQAMEWVGSVLVEATRHVESLQAEIGQLANYFNTIAQIVTNIGENQVGNFLAKVEHRKDAESVQGIPLAKWEGQKIFATLLILRGYFSVVCQNAEFYDDISTQYLLPAIRDVQRLPISASEEEQRKARDQLFAKTCAASKEIIEKGKLRQKEIQTFVDQNIEKIAEETANMPGITEAFDRKMKLIEVAVKHQLEDRPIIEEDGSVTGDEDDEDANHPGELY